MNQTDDLAAHLRLARAENQKLRKSLALLHAYSLKVHQERALLLIREQELSGRIESAFEDGFEAGALKRVGARPRDSAGDGRRAVKDANATASAK
jgi:hypothetical protein